MTIEFGQYYKMLRLQHYFEAKLGTGARIFINLLVAYLPACQSKNTPHNGLLSLLGSMVTNIQL